MEKPCTRKDGHMVMDECVLVVKSSTEVTIVRMLCTNAVSKTIPVTLRLLEDGEYILSMCYILSFSPIM
jgi:hypothetical protein